MVTQLNEPRGVDSDRVDVGRRLWRAVAVSMVFGILVGAAVGDSYGRSRPVTYQATTALSVLPDSAVNAQQGQGGAPSLDAASYIQGQLVILNGTELGDQVQRQLTLAARPRVSSSEVGQTYIVQVTATAPNRQQALAVATATATAFTKQRVQQLSAAITTSLASTNAQIASVLVSLTAARAATSANAAVTPATSALQTEYQRLLSVGSGLSLALSQAAQVVTVQAPASASSAPLSTDTKDLLAGALIGALAGLAILIAGRRLNPRVRTVGDAAALGLPVLLPVLPRRHVWARFGNSTWRSSPGRLLAARLTRNESDEQRPLVIVGATRGVGTSFVAASIAASLADRCPVLLVLSADLTALPDAPNPGANPTHLQRANRHNGADIGELVANAIPSQLAGVWLLPRNSEFPRLISAVPSMRPALFKELLQRASAAGWSVIVDAPALSESDLALDCVGPQAVAALVIGRGVTRPTEVLVGAELFEAHGTPLVGAILNDVPALKSGRSWRSIRHAAGSAVVMTVKPRTSSRPTGTQRQRPRPRPRNGAARSARSTVSLDNLFADELVDEPSERKR
jgi:Mrp family chromosome partitioning ATPase